MKLWIFVVLVFACCSLQAQKPNSEAGLVAFRKLIEGTVTGDTKAMAAAIAEGAPINAVDGAALIVAIQFRQLESLRWLLDHGVNTSITIPDPGGQAVGQSLSPLSYAIRIQNFDAARELIRRGARIDDSKMEGAAMTPTRCAMESADVSFLKELEDLGVNWKAPLPEGKQPLEAAIAGNNPEAVAFLLDGRADPNALLLNGNFPLADAGVIGNPQILKALLDKRADPNAISEGRPSIQFAQKFPHTALMNAVRRNSLECVDLLLKAGADPKALNNSAILWADLLGNKAIFEALVKAGAERPAPYAFLNLPDFKSPDEVAETKNESFTDWSLLTAINRVPGHPSGGPADHSPVSIAVVPLSPESGDAASLLTGTLSKLAGLSLVERSELKALKEEQALTSTTAMTSAARSGFLEGADAVVFLSTNKKNLEIRTVASSSGLVIQSTIIPQASWNQAQAEELSALIHQASKKVSGQPGKRLLVSIPTLTITASTPEGNRLVQELTSALAVFLGAQPDIYILDRSEMRRLALEKFLKSDVEKFFQSGLLIDGGVEFSPNQAGEITLTLRASGLDGSEKAVAEASGPMDQPQQLLLQAGNALLSKLGQPEATATDRTAEARAYEQQARAAYGSQLWSQAHAMCVAAEALGARGDEFLSLRILSLCKLLESDLFNITEGKYSRFGDPREILFRAMPLEFLKEDIAPRTAGDYLDLSNELLDIAAPIAHRTSKPDVQEQKYWEYLPTMLERASLPLEILSTLSDQESHRDDVEAIRTKILSACDAAISKSFEWGFLNTYAKLVVLKCKFLRSCTLDEDFAISEILKLVDQAQRLDPPYVLHELMKHVTDENADTPRRIGTRFSTFPERLSKALAGSELPHARFKGALRSKAWAVGFKHQRSWDEHCAEAFAKVWETDRSPIGISGHRTQEENPPTLKVGALDGKRPWAGLESYYSGWAPNIFPGNLPGGWSLPKSLDTPQSGSEDYVTPQAKQQYTILTRKRLEFMAANGGGPFHFLLPLSILDESTLTEWKQLAEAAHQKLVEREKMEEMPKGLASSFQDRTITPLRNALASLKPLPGLNPTASYQLTIPALLPKFKTLATNPRNFRGINYEYSTESEVWLSSLPHGLISMDPEGKIQAVVSSPEGHYVERISHVTADKIACQAVNEKGERFMGVFDRKAQSWKLFKSTGSGGLSLSPIVVGDALIYFDNQNKDGSVDGTNAKNENTTSFLEEIEIQSGKRSMLVSSRRTPPESPLDNQANRPNPKPLSETETKVGEFVFNTSTRQWRPVTPQEKKNPRSTAGLRRGLQFGNVSVEAVEKDPSTGNLTFLITLSSKTKDNKGSIREKIPFEHPKIEIAEAKDIAAPDVVKEGLKALKASGDFRYEVCRDGLLLGSPYGFAWIPSKDLIPVIEQTLKDLGHSVESPTSR